MGSASFKACHTRSCAWSPANVGNARSHDGLLFFFVLVFCFFLLGFCAWTAENGSSIAQKKKKNAIEKRIMITVVFVGFIFTFNFFNHYLTIARWSSTIQYSTHKLVKNLLVHDSTRQNTSTWRHFLERNTTTWWSKSVTFFFLGIHSQIRSFLLFHIDSFRHDFHE